MVNALVCGVEDLYKHGYTNTDKPRTTEIRMDRALLAFCFGFQHLDVIEALANWIYHFCLIRPYKEGHEETLRLLIWHGLRVHNPSITRVNFPYFHLSCRRRQPEDKSKMCRWIAKHLPLDIWFRGLYSECILNVKLKSPPDDFYRALLMLTLEEMKEEEEK